MKERYDVKRIVIVSLILPLLVVVICLTAQAQAAEGSQGEQAFVKNCAVCHPGGKNIINPAKTLSKKVLSENGIRSAADILRQMRNPGPGMTQFDEKTIPDGTAKAIAEYILKTFQ
jgi:cytochrome c6